MIIDKNPIELEAMRLFKENRGDEATKVQDEFVSELRRHISAGNSYCPCSSACKFHGKCVECVAIHRGHADHLPVCLHPMVKEKLEPLSSLAEHL